MVKENNQPTVVDLFAGGGGFSYGFKKEGFTISSAVEINAAAAQTYERNIQPLQLLVEDIRNISGRELINQSPDVLIGGPPCEAYTPVSLNRMEYPTDRLYVDPRGRLTLEYIRLLAYLKPKVFVMENVIQITEGQLKYALIEEFKWAGYEKIYFNIIRSENYGSPSERTRVFISNIYLKDFLEQFRVYKKTTVWEAIGDLPKPDWPHDYWNHFWVDIPKKFKKRWDKLKFGQAALFFGKKGQTFKDYTKLHPDKISPTVKGSGRFLHPYQPRLLSVREQARLMTYPDDYVFEGGINEQYNQVGESVQPLISNLIAKAVKEFLENGNRNWNFQPEFV
ncbi:MAG: DNA cytosine methyltransferase [Aquificota bacterium]